MICPHCGKAIRLTDIEQRRGKGLKLEFQCPLCQAWLGKSAKIQWAKMLGFYLSLFIAVLAWWQPEFRHFGIPFIIFGVILMLVSHLMDHLLVISAPPRPDNSQDRQKYRP